MSKPLLAIVSLILSTGCAQIVTTDPLFCDVVGEPPRPVDGLSAHIVQTDRNFANWLAGVVVAAIEYGCD